MNIKDFLIKAKTETYANASVPKSESSRTGSSDYYYEEFIDGKKYIYHDTYFGGTKFVGEEVVYIDNDIPVWGMNYYGNIIDENLSEDAMDKALRPALMEVGKDDSILPVRGPRNYKNDGYEYSFSVNGDLKDFEGVEEIKKDGVVIYRLKCHGGIIKK